MKIRGLILGRGFFQVPLGFAVKSLGLGVREPKNSEFGFRGMRTKTRTKNAPSSYICKK